MIFKWEKGVKLADLERDCILTALAHFDGNRTHTAEALGISIRTLRIKIAIYKRYCDIPPPKLGVAHAHHAKKA